MHRHQSDAVSAIAPEIGRVYTAAKRLGLTFVTYEKLHSAVGATFGARCYSYARALAEDKIDRRWHVIESVEDLVGLVFDRQVEALAYLLKYLDQKYLSPSVERVETLSGEEIHFHINDQVIAVIKSVVFTEVNDQDGLARAERVLAGVTTGSDISHVAKRLSRLPGLQEIEGEELIQTAGQAIALSASNLCKQMQYAFLNGFDHKLKLAHAQELVTALFKFDSWNQLVALAKERLSRYEPVYIGWRAPERTVEYFRDYESALWAYSEICKNAYHRNNVMPWCFASSSLGMGGLKIEAWLHPGDEFPLEADVIMRTCTGVDSVPERYLGIAVSLIAKTASEEFTKVTSDFFGAKEGSEARWRAANRRVGYSLEDELVLGNWLFLFENSPLQHSKGIVVSNTMNIGERSDVLATRALTLFFDGKDWWITTQDPISVGALFEKRRGRTKNLLSPDCASICLTGLTNEQAYILANRFEILTLGGREVVEPYRFHRDSRVALGDLRFAMGRFIGCEMAMHPDIEPAFLREPVTLIWSYEPVKLEALIGKAWDYVFNHEESLSAYAFIVEGLRRLGNYSEAIAVGTSVLKAVDALIPSAYDGVLPDAASNLPYYHLNLAVAYALACGGRRNDARRIAKKMLRYSPADLVGFREFLQEGPI